MQFAFQADGGATYRTADGDVLDLVAFTFYGTHEGTTQLLYESNRDIALIDQPFQAGLTIYLPPRAAPPLPPAQIELWD